MAIKSDNLKFSSVASATALVICLLLPSKILHLLSNLKFFKNRDYWFGKFINRFWAKVYFRALPLLAVIFILRAMESAHVDVTFIVNGSILLLAYFTFSFVAYGYRASVVSLLLRMTNEYSGTKKFPLQKSESDFPNTYPLDPRPPTKTFNC